MAQMATNVYKPKMASKPQINTSYNSYLLAVQWPNWQQIFTSPNGQATNNNNMPALQWPKWQTYPP